MALYRCGLSFALKERGERPPEVRFRDARQSIFRPDLDVRTEFDLELVSDEEGWRSLKDHILENGLEASQVAKVFGKCKEALETCASDEIRGLALWVAVDVLKNEKAFEEMWDESLFEKAAMVVTCGSPNRSVVIQALNLVDLSTKRRRELIIRNDMAWQWFQLVRSPPEVLVDYRHMLLRILGRQFRRITVDDGAAYAVVDVCTSVFGDDDISLVTVAVNTLRKLLESRPLALADGACQHLIALSKRGYVDLLVATIRFFIAYVSKAGLTQVLQQDVIAEFAKNGRIVYPNAEKWFLRFASLVADSSLEAAQQCWKVVRPEKYLDAQFDVQMSVLRLISSFARWKICTEWSEDVSCFVHTFLDSDQEQPTILALNLIFSGAVTLDPSDLPRLEELYQGQSEQISTLSRLIVKQQLPT